MQLSAPAPDPVQFDWGPNQVVTHQALNADFYGPWYEFTSLIGALNATGAGAYACGPCVTSIANGTGISASLGSQSSGAGVAATIGLSHGDYADITNAQTIAGAKTFSSPVIVSGSYVAPGFTTSGASLASTLHAVVGVITVTTNSNTQCTPPCVWSQYTGGSVSFSGSAAFASAGSYSCSVGGSEDAGIATLASAGQAATGITGIQIYQIGGGIASKNTQYSFPFTCYGT